MIECVVNVSEGRDDTVLAALTAAAGPTLLDVHRDPDHHRAVLTMVGPAPAVSDGVRQLAETTVSRLDLTGHMGAHPRLGVLDVVPFVPYGPDGGDLAEAVRRRDDFARWLGEELGVPTFLYGPLAGGGERTLPQVRRDAFDSLAPDFGPDRPHRTAGATAVGARPVLVAYNVWVDSPRVAQAVARRVRSPQVRALGLRVGDRAQVSCNLIDPLVVGPEELYRAVVDEVAAEGGSVLGAELVGLIPRAVLERIPADHWAALGLADEATVEARLSRGQRAG